MSSALLPKPMTGAEKALRRRRCWQLRTIVWLVPVTLAALMGCSNSSTDQDTIVVFAASSLTDGFSELAAEFERRHPDYDVELVFAASTTLSYQIVEGAAVDLFASASPEQIESLEAEGLLVDSATRFAINRPALVANRDSDVTTISDLDNPGVTLGLCAPEVPCGVLGAATLSRISENFEISANFEVKSYEPNVKALLTKIELGELDAGVVYQSDLITADAVVEIPLPDDVFLDTEYSIASLSYHPGAATFVEFLQSAEGVEILVAFGFEQSR